MGGKHIVVAGTCQEYGLQSGCLSETFAPSPTTTYGKEKNELRIYLEQLQKNTSFSFQWIRLFYMNGKGQHPTSIIPQLAAAIKRNEPILNMSVGEQTPDYLPVNKVPEYICSIAAQREVDGVVNCCSATPISIKQLEEKFIYENQTAILLNLGFTHLPIYEPMHFWDDNAKLKSIKE